MLCYYNHVEEAMHIYLVLLSFKIKKYFFIEVQLIYNALVYS